MRAAQHRERCEENEQITPSIAPPPLGEYGSAMGSTTASPRVLHGFSVDVEDWFHILDCDAAPQTDTWAAAEDRVGLGTRRFLDLLDKHGHKATFFVLGWVAERHPELIAEIAARGHEVGSHSYGHGLVHGMTRDAFARDLDRSLQALTKATGRTITAFRAPGFSIGNDQSWAFDVLADAGITLDASLFLAPRAHGGFRLSRRGPFEVFTASGKRIVEVPIVPWSPAQLGGRLALPYSGGGYLRLLPAPLLKRLYASAERDGEAVITYLHPRELDPAQPRMDLPPLRAFKYYVGLDTVAPKLEALFAQFRFGTLSEVAAATGLGAPITLPHAA